MVETTALGAAMAAGAAEGIAVWDLSSLTPLATDSFTPAILEDGQSLRTVSTAVIQINVALHSDHSQGRSK